MLGEVDRPQAAVFIRAKPLLAAGVGGFEGVEVGNGIGAVGGIEEEHARFAVVVGLVDNFVEQLACREGFEDFKGDAQFLGFFKGAGKTAIKRRRHIGEAQIPGFIIFNCLHESIGDANGDVKVGDGVFMGLAGDE